MSESSGEARAILGNRTSRIPLLKVRLHCPKAKSVADLHSKNVNEFRLPVFFIFRQFWGKIGPNNRLESHFGLALLPWENPGSAAGYFL